MTRLEILPKIDVTIPWFVSLSVMLVYCAQTAEDIDMISFLYSRQSTSFSPQIFVAKRPTPCWYEHRRHSTANCGGMVRERAMVTTESRYNRSFKWPPRTSLASKWGSRRPASDVSCRFAKSLC